MYYYNKMTMKRLMLHLCSIGVVKEMKLQYKWSVVPSFRHPQSPAWVLMKKKDEDQSEDQVEGIIKLDIRTQDHRYKTSDVRLQVSGKVVHGEMSAVRWCNRVCK